MADGKEEEFSCYSLFSLDDSQRYHCSYCGCDITLRLKCNGCTDFDLCLEVK